MTCPFASLRGAPPFPPIRRDIGRLLSRLQTLWGDLTGIQEVFTSDWYYYKLKQTQD